MNKRALPLLCACLLIFSLLGTASAEVTAVDTPAFETYSVNGRFSVAHLLPLADGSLIFSGSLLYGDQEMEEPYNMGYEVMPERYDAFVIAVDEAGSRLWSLRQLDAQAINEFRAVWPREDGGYVLKYRANEGTWGAQHYLISEEGKVDGMLPMAKLRQDKLEQSLWPVREGYLAGGFFTDFDVVCPMEKGGPILLFDETMEEIWRLEDPRLTGGLYMEMREAEDGFFFFGGSRDGGGITSSPSVLKVSRTGEILWQYVGHKYSGANAEIGLPTADGGALFAATNDPEQPTPRDAGYAASLSKLSAEGAVEWTKLYKESAGFTAFMQMLPLGDGYLLTGYTGEGYGDAFGALYVDGEGEPIASFEVPIDEGAAMGGVYLRLAQAPEGGAYLYYTITQTEDIQMSEWYTYTRPVGAEVHYAKINEGTFGK